MLKARLSETCVTFESVCVEGRTGCNVPHHDRDYRAGLEVANHIHANSTGSSTTLFHGHQNESRSSLLELTTPLQPGLLPTNPRIINLHLAVQGFPSGIHHCPAEFVQHHPRRLIPGQTELTLQKQGGHPTLVRGYQVRCPEPVGQWNLGPVKDGPSCHRNLVPTFGALVTALVHKFIRLVVPASRTSKPIRPTAHRQILLAGGLGGEVGLQLAKRFGEWRSAHPHTLSIGVC